MVMTVSPHGPVAAAEHERRALIEADALLRGEATGWSLVNGQGVRVDLPDTALRLLRQVVAALAQDRPAAVVVLDKELTIPRAASLLDVPPTYLVQRLDHGDIPFTETGTGRRIRFEDLIAFKARFDAERREAMTDLVRLSEELVAREG